MRLTASYAVAGPYPFATKFPLPGMLPFEDIHFQLVDLPPVSADVIEPWMSNALEHADGALLVVDLVDPDCLDHVAAVRQRLEEKRVSLLDRSGPAAAPADVPGRLPEEETLEDPFRVRSPRPGPGRGRATLVG